jgi:hypothetical protein
MTDMMHHVRRRGHYIDNRQPKCSSRLNIVSSQAAAFVGVITGHTSEKSERILERKQNKSGPKLQRRLDTTIAQLHLEPDTRQ